MKCKVCGKEFPKKHRWNRTYCSEKCREKNRRPKRRNYFKLYMRKWRNVNQEDYLGTELSNSSIIMVNGQERIKGRITLERLIMGMKEGDVYSP